MEKISILFSDIDGTCVHYPDVMGDASVVDCCDNQGRWHATATDGATASLIKLPPSSTGYSGVISVRTLQLYAAVRALGVKVVLISGGRLSTIMSRLPYLPAADAIVCESGGRIFYPSSSLPTAMQLQEDLQWRLSLGRWAGAVSNECLPPEQRDGVLWAQYTKLAGLGYNVDAASYSTAFRVRCPPERVQELRASLLPGLATSQNLGAIDVYPEASGKAKAAQYLMTHFGSDQSGRECVFICGKVIMSSLYQAAYCCCSSVLATSDSGVENLSSTRICLLSCPDAPLNWQCTWAADDDNDLELAFAVKKAFLPGITAPSVQLAVDAAPSQFYVATRRGVWGTEEVLDTLLNGLLQLVGAQ